MIVRRSEQHQPMAGSKITPAAAAAALKALGMDGEVGVLDILRHAPVVVGVFASSEELHKLFVVGDDDELKVALLATRGDDAAWIHGT
jgi:hypothetical protein